MFVRQVETRFWNGIVRGSCGYFQYGQVLGDYVDYVVSTQLLFCLLLNVLVINYSLPIVLIRLVVLCSFLLQLTLTYVLISSASS